MADRPTPFELVFGELKDRFEAIQQRLEASGVAADDRDRFLLQREVAELLRELRPESGLGAEVEMLGAWVHHAYRFWRTGERVRVVTREELMDFLEDGRTAGRQVGRGLNEGTGGPAAGPSQAATLPSGRPAILPSCEYVQPPPLAIWAELESGPPQPLDGWFAARVRPDELEVLAVLGMHPGRPGFTAVEVRGPRPDQSNGPDRMPRFAPVVSETGARAGLASVGDAGELLELAWLVEHSA